MRKPKGDELERETRSVKRKARDGKARNAKDEKNTREFLLVRRRETNSVSSVVPFHGSRLHWLQVFKSTSRCCMDRGLDAAWHT